MAGSLYGFGTNPNTGVWFLKVNKSSPVQTIAYGTNWSSISAYGLSVAAIKNDGTLWLWGRNYFGQLGNNTTISQDSPVQTISYGSNWNSVSCGYSYTAGIKTDGTLWLWGTNYGQLGDNTVVKKSSPVQTVAYGTDWDSVSCGSQTTGAIKKDGTLWLWGVNQFGSIGDNTIIRKSSPVQTVAYGNNWSKIALGDSHAAGIKTDGTLWTWGKNSFGQLGDNTTTHRSSPIQTVAYGNNWSQVSCGTDQTLALKTDGTLWGWGYNQNGQLADNTNTNRSSPVQTVTFSTEWSQISTGYRTSGAIKKDGTLWIWSRNAYGELGTNSLIWTSSPVQTITYGTNWSKIAIGRSYAAGLKSDGTLWTWGRNSYGQLGDDSVYFFQAKNISFDNQVMVVGKSLASPNFVAAIKNDKSLWLWGWNDRGQLGNNSTTDTFSPIQTISNGNNWESVSCGGNFVASIKTDGTLWLWGNNTNGQIGDNSIINKSSPVQTVAYGTNWSLVSIGASYAAAIKTDNTLWTWGYNGFGQLGDATIIHRSSPIQVISSGSYWSYVSCGGRHIFAGKSDGSFWSWGSNAQGQFGNGTTISRSSPIQVFTAADNWSQIYCGYSCTFGIKKDGTLWSWGQNNYGQLGDNTTINKSSPVQTVVGGTDWIKTICSSNYVMGIKNDNSMWVWGQNNNGQLGDNTIIHRSSPVQVANFGTRWYDAIVGIGGDKSTFVILENDPNQLSINTQPQAGIASNQLIVQPKININDSAGSLVRNASSTVSVSVYSGSASLSGTTTVTAVNGVATFTDLSLTGMGAVTLRFTSSGLTQADSNSFLISVFLPIIPKRSEVSGKVPTSGQLNIGELAVNIEDKKGYVKKSDGTIVNLFNGAVYDGGTF